MLPRKSTVFRQCLWCREVALTRVYSGCARWPHPGSVLGKEGELVEISVVRHALDRVPLSLIVDDSTPLINLNYFFLRDRNIQWGQNQRWEDMPVVHPESFTREWAEWCSENSVRGKFSVVPCPAGLGRIDQGLPLFGQRQLDSWLRMCREVIMPSFDITPEMLTHSFVLDLETMQPLESRIWEQYEWEALPEDQEELITDYIAMSCQILANVGLSPTGVTSPGNFGGKTLAFYAKVAGNAVRQVTGNPTPFFFNNIVMEGSVPVPVWYLDRSRGTAVGEIVASTGDWTGSWTGYGTVDPDKYITGDLCGGRLPELIEAGDPAVLISHWQGFYGMHNEDRRGFKTLKTVVRRLQELDPYGERTRWRKVSEITNYACAREAATLSAEGLVITLDLPILAPEFTLRLVGERPRGIRVDGNPLRQVASRRYLESGTFYAENEVTLLAFDPERRTCRVEVLL